MLKLLNSFCIYIVTIVLLTSSVKTAGISVDAGLTPPEDRWMFRTQLRYMSKENDMTRMNSQMIGSVFAYGLRRNVTLMVKQMVINRTMTMGGMDTKISGLSDLSLMCKYGIFRKNTRDYTVGVASTIALKIPSGDDAFTSETWDVRPGLYLSWRKGYWATDVSLAYARNGFAGENSQGIEPGDEISFDGAAAYQISMGNKSRLSFTPVLELSYNKFLPDNFNNQGVINSGESILFISPGVKLTKSSFIFETLLQLPAWQDQNGTQLKHSARGLVGIRFMF